MKNIYSFLLLSLFFITTTFGQNSPELDAAIGSLQAVIKEVSSKSAVYKQSIEWDDETPHKIIIKQEKVLKKKTESMSYEFSFRDVDINTIRVKNKKDLMLVNLFINNKQNLIKVFKNGEQERYVNQLTLIAIDDDNGKAIKKELTKAIEALKHIKLSRIPSTFDSKINWLSENIKEFKINKTTFKQTFAQSKEASSMVSYQKIEEGEKVKEELWAFDLEDLNPHSIQMQVKGKEMYVEVQTKNNSKYIQYEKDNKQGNYTNKLKFFMSDFDKARRLMAVLEKLIENSVTLNAKKYSNSTSLNDVFDVLNKTISNIKGDNIEITQSIKPSCVSVFTRTKQRGEKSAIGESFKFNFSDIQSELIKIKVKGKDVTVELSTGKIKLIQSFKNGELQKYSGKINIYADGIENAKMLVFTISELINFCKKEASFKPSADFKENLTWINEQLSKVNDTNGSSQYIESVEGKSCKWKITTIKVGKKQSKEEVFEFNLDNLNESTLKYKISGKNLFIEIDTYRHEKSIKYYKDGEPGDYKKSLLIQLNDIEDARNMIQVFKKEIKGCKQ